MTQIRSQPGAPIQLVWPSEKYLQGYISALKRGWSPDTSRAAAAAREALERIAKDPRQYVEALVDREAKGGPVVLPDGSTRVRLPGYSRWIWDGQFCGVINFRWQPGTSALPPHCLGHIGYAVVPWKQRRGYATEALRQLLPETRAEGIPYLEITTDVDNIASQRVIEANGGVLIERFQKPSQYGGAEGLRFHIPLR